MARERQYDRTEVIRHATRVFWARGYASTPVSELVKATRLNTASMYKEFGTKEDFFCAVMDHAWATDYQVMLAPLRENQGLESLRAYLLNIAHHASSPRFQGCLFLNHLAQRGTVPPRVLTRIGRFCDDLRELFRHNLRTARDAGEIPAGSDVDFQAHHLLCFVQGIALFGRLSTLRPQVQRLVEGLLQGLRQGSPAGGN